MTNTSRWTCLAAALLAALLSRPAAAQAPGAPPALSDSESTPPPPPPSDDTEPPPPDALPPQSTPDLSAFQADLSPYGRWVNTPEYGQVWAPNAAARGDWQPYSDGHWVYTEWGWSFVSDVPWGWAPFHYGRWGWTAGLGWFWVPGFVWAPAWVSWRYTNGHVAWSPFGPRGFQYQRRWPGWVTVPSAHFTHPIERERIPRAHAAPIVRTARPAPSIQRLPERGHPYGPPRDIGKPRAGGKRPSEGGEHGRGH